METAKATYLLGVTAFFVSLCFPASGQPAPKGQSFEWATRLELTLDQSKLMHLHNKLVYDSADQTKAQQTKEELERLAAKLGPLALRRARAGELILSQNAENGMATIYNPSGTNLAFTVSVKGDEEWMGSRKASMGRDTYLPPKCTLTVTNFYWSSPGMSKSAH
jgi:hypothetical protein